MSFLDTFFQKKDLPIKKKLNLGDMSNNQVLLTSQFLTNAYYNYMRMGESDLPSVVSELNAMYRDDIIQNAMEMISNDATSISNGTNKRIWVSTEHEYIEKETDKLFNLINIQDKIKIIANRLILLGNCIVRLNYKNKDDQNGASGGVGYIEIEEDIFRYTPIEINGVMIKYFDKYTQTLLEPYEIIFLKIDPMYDCTMTDQLFGVYYNNVKFNQNKNTFKYGVSIFENVRRLWRQIKILQDSLILARLEKSPTWRIVKAKVDSKSEPSDVKNYIDTLTNLFTSQKTISTTESLLKNEPFNTFGSSVIIPVLEGQDVTWENMGGDVDVTSIIDIEMFMKGFYASLKVPKEFLGLGDETGGITIGENSLIRKEIRYARMVRGVQYNLIQAMKNLAFYHLLSLNKDVKYEDFDCIMNVISSAEEEELKSTLNKSVESIKNIIDAVTAIKDLYKAGEINKKGLDSLVAYITANVLSGEDFNWGDIFDDIKPDVPEEETPEENDMGGDIDMGEETINEETPETEIDLPETPILRKPKMNFKANNFKQNNKVSNRKKEYFSSKKSPNSLLILASMSKPTQKKVIRILETMNIPKLDMTSSLSYIKESYTKKDTKYIVETVKKIKLEDFRKYAPELRGFSADILGLKIEPKEISLLDYKTERITETVNINNIYFMEGLYLMTDISNYVSSSNVVTVYKLKSENKYYINYNNSLNLFKHLLENNKFTTEVMLLSEK